MSQFQFNTQPTQHYTTTADVDYVNRGDRPTTPDIFSPYNLGDRSTIEYYTNNLDDPSHDPQDANPPLPSPLLPLLSGILIIYIYKKFPQSLHISKKSINFAA